jgi:hypothetical protein
MILFNCSVYFSAFKNFLFKILFRKKILNQIEFHFIFLTIKFILCKSHFFVNLVIKFFYIYLITFLFIIKLCYKKKVNSKSTLNVVYF